jgi:hypothetical protein
MQVRGLWLPRKSAPREGFEPSTYRLGVVRVTSVLIFARAPACVAFVLARTPDGQGHLPRVDSRQDLRCASRTRHPACRHRRAGPGPTAVPHRNAAPRQTRRRRTTRTLGKDHHAHQARLSITPAQWPAPRAATHAVPTTHHPAGDSNPPETRSTTTHSKEKRLLSIPKPPSLPNICTDARAAAAPHMRADIPVLASLHQPDDLPSSRPDCGGIIRLQVNIATTP